MIDEKAYPIQGGANQFILPTQSLLAAVASTIGLGVLGDGLTVDVDDPHFGNRSLGVARNLLFLVVVEGGIGDLNEEVDVRG